MIALQDAVFGYRADRPVVRGLTAALQPGRVTALIGPNGCGKSTLLKLMLGLLKPQSGAVAWLHGNVTEGGKSLKANTPAWPTGPVCQQHERQRAAWLAYVPQHGSVAFGFSVREVVAMPDAAALGMRSTGESRQPQVVADALSAMALDAVAEQPFETLSGGQQQRVVLARALVQRAIGHAQGGLFLDEPVSAMDLQHAQAVGQVIRRQADAGETVVVVLHDLTLAAQWADDVWLMHEGQLVGQGPVGQLMEPDTLAPVYGVGLDKLTDRHDRPVFAVV